MSALSFKTIVKKLLTLVFMPIILISNISVAFAMPDGVKGYDYYIALGQPSGYASSAIEACQKSAVNHAGNELKYMNSKIVSGNRTSYGCFYRVILPMIFNWKNTILHCDAGYTSYLDTCTKDPEPRRQCTASNPTGGNLTGGNPTMLATGEKQISKRDYTSAGTHPFEIGRYYKSASELPGSRLGNKWRFSFDAAMSKSGSMTIAIAPDGTHFQFTESGGIYSLKNDQGSVAGVKLEKI